MISMQFLLVRRCDLTPTAFTERLLNAHRSVSQDLAEGLGIIRHSVSVATCDRRTACLRTVRPGVDWTYDALATLTWLDPATYDAAVGQVGAFDTLEHLMKIDRHLIDIGKSTARVAEEVAIAPSTVAASYEDATRDIAKSGFRMKQSRHV